MAGIEATFSVNDRVRGIDPDTNKQRSATVMEICEATGYVRVCFDLKWMHDWIAPGKLTAHNARTIGER